VSSRAEELSPEMRARYGVTPTSRWSIAAIATLAAAFALLIGWITWQLAKPSAQVQLVKFNAVSSQRVDLTFDLQRDPAATTTCVLRARDVHHIDVGYAQVEITPGRKALQIDYPLATLATATSAEVLGCADNAIPRVDAPEFAPGTVNPPQHTTIDGT